MIHKGTKRKKKQEKCKYFNLSCSIFDYGPFYVNSLEAIAKYFPALLVSAAS
jgi:hypothetical protein